MKKRKKIISLILSLIFILCTISPFFAAAKTRFLGYYGDLDNNMYISGPDLSILINYMFGKTSYIDDAADMDGNSKTDISDLILLKSTILGQTPCQEIYAKPEDAFLDQVTTLVDASLPSHGKVNIPVFFIDFPDCGFDDDIECDVLKTKIFGPQNEQSPDYPFESISAFFERSSKGSLKLDGNVYRYTARNPISFYSESTYKTELTEECITAFENIIDFHDYDSDRNGTVDTLVFSVPDSADDQYWWPCAGIFGDYTFTANELKMGHTIIGNESVSDTIGFNSGYSHELGHCLGLPDYYIYDSDNSEGLRGPAGTEMMDVDAASDFCAVSKFMLGWYRKNDVIFGYASPGKTYTLYNAQSDKGNCIIIPKHSEWKPTSEFFIIEYQTETRNNSGLDYVWWQDFSEGVRIYHANANTSANGWWRYFTYEASGPEVGKRFIRLVNDGKPAFINGDIIDKNTPGFRWYNDNGEEAVDTEFEITINSMDKDKCSVTISYREL